MSAAITGMDSTARIRRVLDAPRGRRFSKPSYPAPQTREQRLLAQMEGNPRVAYRQAHGVLPAWMEVQNQRIAAREQERPRPGKTPIPRPRTAPDDGPAPVRQPRQTPPPPTDKPPLPRRRSKRPHGHRPHGHRRPRRWFRTGPARLLAAYTLASGVGALAHHLATTLA